MNTCISLKISWQENNYRFFSDGAGVKVEDMHMMQPENKLKFFTSEVRFLEKSKQKCKKTTYKNRYKHKLNMLWPGQTMLKIVGMFLLIGILFWLLKCRVSASAAFVLAGVVFAVLLLLVAIELHQDRVLNEIAMRENEEKYGE